MALQEYLALGDGSGRLNAAQVNQAFRDVYGIDAPPKVLYDFAGTGAENIQNFYDRVSRGDFVPDINKRDPGYFQRAQVEQLANQQLSMQKKANEPVAQSMEASKSSLKDRYDAILADLTNRETKDTQTIQKNAAQEFSKRGIPLTSDAYTKELAKQVAVPNQDYGVQRAAVNAELGTKLSDLDTAIAKLRAGNPDVALPAANSLFGPVQSADLAQKQFQDVTLPQSQESIRSSKYQNSDEQFRGIMDLIKQYKSSYG